jgi:hypothetical protein
MTVGSWKAANFIIPDYAGGDDLFDFRGDDGTTGGDGAATMPPSLYSYGLQDLFGRLEDLLSHSAPAEVLQAIHNAFQNVIEQLPHIDLPNLPDLSHVWHEGGAALPGGEYAGVASQGVEGAPSNPVASSVVASQSPPGFYGSGSGVSGPDQSATGHDSQSKIPYLSHDWW